MHRKPTSSYANSIPTSPHVKKDMSVKHVWDSKPSMLRTRPYGGFENHLKKTFQTLDYSRVPCTSELILSHRRGKSFDDTRPLASISRDSHRSLNYSSTRAIESRSTEIRPQRESRLNDYSWASKKIDLSTLNASTRHNIFLLEKGASIQNISLFSNGFSGTGISKFKSSSMSTARSQADLASTGDRKASNIEAERPKVELSLDKSPRVSLSLLRHSARPKHLAQIHKSVQHMDIMEHDAELEQDISVSILQDDSMTADGLSHQIAAAMLKHKLTDTRLSAVEDIFRSHADPFKSACRYVADYCCEMSRLKDRLDKKTKLEDVYLAEINKLQTELSKQSNSVNSPRSPYSATKNNEKKRNLRSLKQITSFDKTNYK